MLVTVISKRRLIVLFVDGLMEPQKGRVKGFNPVTLMEAIKKAHHMALSSSSSASNYSHLKPPLASKEKDNKPPPKKSSLDEATRQELRRKKLCFTYKEPWELGHRCLGRGKIHYIEVMSDNEEEQGETKWEGND